MITASITVAVLAATGAFASRKPPRSTSIHFSVFSGAKNRTTAHAAAVPPGTILAATETNGGVKNEIYVRQESGEYCVLDVQAKVLSGTTCANPQTVGAIGLDLTIRGHNAVSTVSVLVPDGVHSATFVDADGAEHTVPVENDVVALADPKIASVHYVMPSGAAHTVEVPPAKE